MGNLCKRIYVKWMTGTGNWCEKKMKMKKIHLFIESISSAIKNGKKKDFFLISFGWNEWWRGEGWDLGQII